MNNTGRWTYQLSWEDMWQHDTYDTKEEAIEVGIREAKENRCTIIFIGQTLADVEPCVDTDVVIENIQENMQEEFGEYAEDYLDNIKEEERKDLDNKLNAVLQKWLEDNKYEPDFYHIINIEKIKVESEASKNEL